MQGVVRRQVSSLRSLQQFVLVSSPKWYASRPGGQLLMMRRREFITFGMAIHCSGAAADRMRRLGVIMGFAETVPEGHVQAQAFEQGLQEFGWTVGRSIR
jgi:hypothetical protein